MRPYITRMITLTALYALSAASYAWDFDGNMVVTTQKAEAFSLAFAPSSEVLISRLLVNAKVEEGGTQSALISDNCTRFNFGDMSCSATATDASVTIGTAYCGNGVGRATANYVPLPGGLKNWGSTCKTAATTPPGPTNVTNVEFINCHQPLCALWEFVFSASGASDYRIERKPLSGGSWTPETVTSNTSFFPHLASNALYHRIRAENSVGDGPWITISTSGQCNGGGGGQN